ncbi:hypothetical protein ACTOB_001231 [Actinoplanes oblitus]|uniref:Uncharacterized protein n=1 Tax=Actinoplanes oblitus TaxID=3040509 RepID=A0ABY8WKS9_9ACTN|nr:hypothetical protein [Actinoplanes oblitus]WIM97683.1 hypothetical protein ACTOB_001231 [Actinoplanes oblitus]
MDTKPRTRNTNPELRKLTGLLGPLTRDGRHAEAAAVRVELDRVKRLAAIQAAAKNAPPLTAAELSSIVGMLAAVSVPPAVAPPAPVVTAPTAPRLAA